MARRKDEKRANGEGSCYQMPNGKWRGQVVIGWETTPEGKRRAIRQTVVRDYQREVLAEVTRIQSERDAGKIVVGTAMTLGEYLDWWLPNIAKPRTYISTWLGYEMKIRLYIKPSIGHVPLRRLKATHLDEFYASLAAAGKGARTIELCHAILHTALKTALKRELVGVNVADIVDRVPHPQKRPPSILNIEQARDLLEYLDGSYWQAIYTLALTTGLREGELFGLRLSDFDFDVPRLVLARSVCWKGEGWHFKDAKSHKIRGVTLTDLGVAAVRAHVPFQAALRAAAGSRWQENDLLFSAPTGIPLTSRNFLRSVHYPSLAAAGLPVVRFHDLRHTAASILINLGVPLSVVKDILGHSTIQITDEVYGHLLPGAQPEAMAKMQKALGE